MCSGLRRGLGVNAGRGLAAVSLAELKALGGRAMLFACETPATLCEGIQEETFCDGRNYSGQIVNLFAHVNINYGNVVM